MQARKFSDEWQGFNLAEAHNKLVSDPLKRFPQTFVDGTQKSCRSAAAACSTAYTGLVEIEVSNNSR